jgi:high-affinity iron transporter
MILIFSLAAAALPAFAREPTDESGGGGRPQAAALEEHPAAASEAQPAVASEAQPLRRVVALLDYVSGDYPRAVGPNGEVLSAAEHQEQIGFVQDAARELRAAVDGKGEDLAQRLDALGKLVAARGPPDRVASQAREVRDQIVQRFQVVLRPLKPPDLAHGAQVYAQSCAACHGADGHPNLGLGLETRPPDFASAEEMKPLSPQRVFNATTYGVPRTQMPAFDTGLDDASRWDVAFYLLSIAHPGAPPRGLELARAALVPTRFADLASLSDGELRARLAAAGLSDAEQEEALAALRGGPFTSEQTVQPQGLAQARHDVAKAASLAHAGDREEARRTLISAYLDHFEPHEAGLRARDSALVIEVESAFLALRASIESGQEVDASAAHLDALLERAEARPAGGALVAFVAALAIALREGVEAALLVAAMLALLRKAGRAADANAVHVGWISALAAGAATWWLSGVLLARVSGARRELIEGVLQLVLAALILYASHWLFHAMSSRKLVAAFFHRSMAGASSAVVLGLTFVAVYREAFETVLFFRGLTLESPQFGAAILLGAFCGLVALVTLVAAFQRLGRKLKPRMLLVGCGFLLSGLAVLLVGNGVRSLQVLGVLPLTVWGAFQLPALGLFATREGLLAQGLVLAFLAATALWHTLRGLAADRHAHASV